MSLEVDTPAGGTRRRIRSADERLERLPAAFAGVFVEGYDGTLIRSRVSTIDYMKHLSRTIWRGAVAALALLTVLAPSARSQEVTLDREQLTRYARAHLALDVARDEFHTKIAGVHDDLGLARAREEFDARIAQIYAENAITSEQYATITLLISQDQAIRAVFDEITARLKEGGGGS